MGYTDDHRFGYVKFSTVEAATQAMDQMNMTIFEGRHISVQFAAIHFNQFRVKQPPSKILYIGNLAYELTDRDLNALFKDIENVIDVRIPVDRRTGQMRGFAHVEFLNTESAMRAREMLSLKAPYGRKMKVDFAQRPGKSLANPWPGETKDRPSDS